jgi:hypothetical protein
MRHHKYVFYLRTTLSYILPCFSGRQRQIGIPGIPHSQQSNPVKASRAQQTQSASQSETRLPAACCHPKASWSQRVFPESLLCHAAADAAPRPAGRRACADADTVTVAAALHPARQAHRGIRAVRAAAVASTQSSFAPSTPWPVQRCIPFAVTTLPAASTPSPTTAMRSAPRYVPRHARAVPAHRRRAR